MIQFMSFVICRKDNNKIAPNNILLFYKNPVYVSDICFANKLYIKMRLIIFYNSRVFFNLNFFDL